MSCGFRQIKRGLSYRGKEKNDLGGRFTISQLGFAIGQVNCEKGQNPSNLSRDESSF